MTYFKRYSEGYHDKENVLISQYGDELAVTLTYPNHNLLKYVIFDQESTRGSDGIRISYDYDRDGYKIEQPTKTSFCSVDEKQVWVEVAFVQAWASSEEEEQ